ncbi:MAG: hypothetical protein IKV49_04000 [Clostridia bacterium]|nr:hypothetical protein [Clostridia bacterium]
MKKLLAILLSVIIAFSLSVSIFAKATDDKCDCGYIPVVFVTGFAYTELVANAGTEDEYGAFGVETEAITDMITGLIAPLLWMLVSRDFDYFAHRLSADVMELFYDASCDENGNPKNPTVDIERFNPPTAEHYKDDYFTFRYDWRKDVFDIAAELNDYIEETKRLTGHDKVAIRAESMGGAVTMTYLQAYGYDSVETVVMQSSAFDGISTITSLFLGDLTIDSQSLINYIGNFMEGNSPDMVFYRALYLSLAKFIFNPVVALLGAFIGSIDEIVYDECIKPLFGYIPGVWTFVTGEAYEDAKAFMLDEEVNAVLIKKIDRYHYEVQDKCEEIIADAMANGVNFAIISNYGKGALPLGEDSTMQSDFLIETAHTSLGATCSDYGVTLGEGYTQAVNDGHNHLSPDGMIDASTCAFPEITWFIKDMVHTWYTDGYDEFVYKLIYTEGQETIYTYAEYPQFMVNNQQTEALEPLTAENSDTQSTKINVFALVSTWIEQIKNAE